MCVCGGEELYSGGHCLLTGMRPRRLHRVTNVAVRQAARCASRRERAEQTGQAGEMDERTDGNISPDRNAAGRFSPNDPEAPPGVQTRC